MKLLDTIGYTYINRSDIRVINVTIKKIASVETLENCLERGIEDLLKFDKKLKAIIPNEKMLFCGRTASLQNPNILQKKKGIWGNSEFRWSADCKKTDSFEKSDNKGIFYAGICEVNSDNVFDALNHTRTKSRSLIIYSDDIEVNVASVDLFQEILDKKNGTINWENVIINLCKNHNAIIKVDGKYDDNEVSIDIYLTKDFYEYLANYLSN